VEVARLLRQHTKKKRIILVANKCDDPYTMMDVEERNKIATGTIGYSDLLFQGVNTSV